MMHLTVLQILGIGQIGQYFVMGQPDFVRWLMSDGFVRQSKRAINHILDLALY